MAAKEDALQTAAILMATQPKMVTPRCQNFQLTLTKIFKESTCAQTLTRRKDGSGPSMNGSSSHQTLSFNQPDKYSKVRTWEKGKYRTS